MYTYLLESRAFCSSGERAAPRAGTAGVATRTATNANNHQCTRMSVLRCRGPDAYCWAAGETTVTDLITTGWAGTSEYMPLRPVCTCSIFFTTSVPSMTLPNTA